MNVLENILDDYCGFHETLDNPMIQVICNDIVNFTLHKISYSLLTSSDNKIHGISWSSIEPLPTLNQSLTIEVQDFLNKNTKYKK